MKIFIGISGGVSEETWKDMSEKEKANYVKEHPTSKYAQQDKPAKRKSALDVRLDEIAERRNANIFFFEKELIPNPNIFPDDGVSKFKRFGKLLEKLVKEYEQYNPEESIFDKGGSYSVKPSRKIEFHENVTLTSYGHNAHFPTQVKARNAVSIGNAYPKDKALEFMKKYVKLMQKHLPKARKVRDAEGNISVKDFVLDIRQGQTRSTFAITG